MKQRAIIWIIVSVMFVGSKESFAQSIDQKVLEGAKREGEVAWYSTLTLDMSTQLLDRFKKKYPFIKRTPLYVGSGTPVLNKILTEDRGGLRAWDVLQGNAEMVPPLMEKKLLASYRSPETKMIDDDLIDKQGYWSAIYLLSYVLGWNTGLVKKDDVPKTYEALLDAKWKGKISVDSEGYAMFKGFVKAWGKDKAVAYLKSLAANDPLLKRGSTARATLLVAGEYPLVMAFNQTMQRMITKGATVDWLALEPAVVVLDLIAIASKSPHPNAARLFYDFLISKEGQEGIREFEAIPVRKDVTPNPPRMVGYKRVVVEPNDFKDFDETVKLYNQIFKLQ